MKPLFTSAQWSLIDLGNQYGLDKKPYEERIKWAKELLPNIKKCVNISQLATEFTPFIESADEPELFTAALLNVWDIARGVPTGHYIELDASSSGPQLLSVLTRCEVGMANTGAIGEDVPDLYTTIYKIMQIEAPALYELTRTQVKKATVPYVYGSRKAPKAVFGSFAKVFTQAYYAAVPRAEVIKNLLISAWNPNTTSYEWELPDGHTAHIKVIGKDQVVFYHNRQPITYHFEEVMTKEYGEEGTSMLASRVTHSYDAYVLRETNARCDYNRAQLLNAKDAIMAYLRGESQSGSDLELKRLERISAKFKQVSIRGVDFIQRGFLHGIDKNYLMELVAIIDTVLPNKACQLKLIHDGFGALANHVSTLKTHYNNVLVDSYRGEWLFSVVETLTGVDYRSHVEPPKPEIIKQLANNKYAIS